MFFPWAQLSYKSQIYFGLVGEIEQAFSLGDVEFQEKYKFSKPAQDTNIVCACFAGKRAAAACSLLKEKFGYSSAL